MIATSGVVHCGGAGGGYVGRGVEGAKILAEVANVWMTDRALEFGKNGGRCSTSTCHSGSASSPNPKHSPGEQPCMLRQVSVEGAALGSGPNECDEALTSVVCGHSTPIDTGSQRDLSRGILATTAVAPLGVAPPSPSAMTLAKAPRNSFLQLLSLPIKPSAYPLRSPHRGPP